MTKNPQGRFTKLTRCIFAAAKLPVTNNTLGMIATIIVPVLIGIIGIKTYKLVFALWPVTQTTLGWNEPTFFEGICIVLCSPLSMLSFLCFLVVSFSLFITHVITKKRWLETAGLQHCITSASLNAAILLFSSLLVIVMVLLFKFVKAVMTETPLTEIWSSWTLGQAFLNLEFVYGMYHDDILFLVGYALLVMILLSLSSSNRWRRLISSLFMWLSLTILIVSALELAHYLKTGMNGTASILLYFLANAGDLWALAKTEFDWKTILAIIVPPLLMLLVPSFARLFRQWGLTKSQQGNLGFNAGKVFWPVLLVLGLVSNHVDQGYIRLSGNPFLKICRDLIFVPALSAEAFVEGKNLRYMAENLAFIPTASNHHLNVVIVMLESVRANATGIYNRRLQNTPFLQNLSHKSLVVEEMHSVIPRTSTAWVSVLQGVYPSTNSQLMFWSNQQAKNPTFPSLPKLLRKAGYKSAFFTPTHFNYENEGQLISNMGFDQVVSEKDYGKTTYEHVNYFGLEDNVMIDPILSWVDGKRMEQVPFLLTIMTNVGHEKYSFPSTWKKQVFSIDKERVRDEKHVLTEASNDDYENYLNCIAYIDDFLKRLFYEFEGRRLLQSTIFFILGDHGDSFGEHGTRERALSLNEETLHIPMLIFAPALFSNGNRIIGPRQQIDILPTIAEMLGYSIENGQLPGISLLRNNPPERDIYYSSVLEGVALGMRKGSRKYIYKFDVEPMQIYDLESDPYERHNLVDKISETEVQVAKNQMLRWSEATKISMGFQD